MKCFPGKILPFLPVLLLAGCSSPEFFSKDIARTVLQANPVQLDGEQLLLTEDQVNCGDQEELWLLTQLGPGRSIGRLTDKGRSLQLSDDVRVGGTSRTGGATVQVRGKFPLRVLQVPSFEDGGHKTMMVEAKIAVMVDHECFNRAPLPTLLGVRKGEFSASENPMFRLRFKEFWTVDELLH